MHTALTTPQNLFHLPCWVPPQWGLQGGVAPVLLWVLITSHRNLCRIYRPFLWSLSACLHDSPQWSPTSATFILCASYSAVLSGLCAPGHAWNAHATDDHQPTPIHPSCPSSDSPCEAFPFGASLPILPLHL